MEIDPVQKTKTHQYSAHTVTVVIKKSPVGTYTATAEIKKEGENGSINLCFPPENGKENGPPLANLPCLSGKYLAENPYKFIVDYCQGIIDAIIKNPENSSKIEAITMRPRTNPTPDQLAEMKKGIRDLVELFGAAGLAHLSGQSTETITNWAARGRISATQAHKICQHPAVSQAGFTREKLRPDVKSWVQMDYPQTPKTGYVDDQNT